ncbi:MAG: hypothetical protein ACLT5H_08345 [Collinsella stercoris]|uniref:hypothetical protein n=1 Tax=Collinsella stercoris TaxID=147206 RepID=UPI00399420B2
MSAIEGRWVARYRQATYGVTPIQRVNAGIIADLIIESGGLGYTQRKRLFGREKVPITWQTLSTKDEVYLIRIGVVAELICSFMNESHDRILTLWTSRNVAIDEMAVVFERVYR